MADVVTNVGFNDTAKLLGGTATVAPFKYIAIGTGTTTATSSDTALGNEVMREEATVTVNNSTLTLQHTFNLTASYAITELGIFNDATAGDMLARSDFGALNLSNGDSLQVTATFDIGS